MASRSSFEEDLCCPVCCDIFINPVVLSCSHSVCEDCIQKFWENKRLKECPVCRSSSREHPLLNLALKNLCETYQQKPSQRSSFRGESICSLHNEKLKLFCLDDQQPVCLVCRDSRKHANHRFCPVDEAVMDNKEILKDSLERLKEKLKIFENFKHRFNEDDEQIKCNAQHAEKKIKEEFEELHQFLLDEETARIKALREEEKQRSQMMKQKIEETSEHISSLSCTIRDIEEQMKTEDVSFLQNYNVMLQRAQCNLLVPEYRPVMTINFSKHLTNLKFTVLQKMQEIFASCLNVDQSYFPSDLTARAISDDREKYSEYGNLSSGVRISTSILGGQLFSEDRPQFPRKPHVVAVGKLSTIRSREPTNKPKLLESRHLSSSGRLGGHFLRRHQPTLNTCPVYEDL